MRSDRGAAFLRTIGLALLATKSSSVLVPSSCASRSRSARNRGGGTESAAAAAAVVEVNDDLVTSTTAGRVEKSSFEEEQWPNILPEILPVVEEGKRLSMILEHGRFGVETLQYTIGNDGIDGKAQRETVLRFRGLVVGLFKRSLATTCT